jgi:hypothetical protein
MKKPLGLLLVIIGGILLFQGFSRKDSLAGDAAEAGTKIANKVDGGTRVPEHTMYIVSGGVLVLAGAAALLRKTA